MKKLLSIMCASVAAVAVGSSLVACGGGGRTNRPAVEVAMPDMPTGAVNISVWAPDGAISVYEEMVKDFKAANPDAASWNVTFEAKGEGDAASAVRTDPATGPNMYFLASDQIVKQVDQSSLQPLPTKMVDKILKRDADGACAAAYVDGYYYCFPNANSNGYFLIYDTEFFSEKDVKSLDTMVEKAAKAGKKLTFNYNNGFYNCSFFFGMGLGLGDTSSDGKIDIDSELGYEAGKTFVKYFGTGATGVWSTDGGNNGIAEGFKSGDVVAGISGTWVNENGYMDKMVANTEGWSEERVGYTKLPEFKATNGKTYQMGSFMGAKYLGINPAKSEAEVAASLYLADFFNTQENQIKRYLATGDAPTNIEASKDSRVTANRMLAALAAQNAAGGHAQVDVPTNFWSALTTFGDNIYDGVTTLDNINAAVDALAAALRQ